MSLFTLLVSIFWCAMIYTLIQREYFPQSSSTFKRAYKQSLSDIKKVTKRRMVIYYGTNPRAKIGYLHSVVQPREDGTYNISTSCQFSLSVGTLFGWQQIKSIFGFGHSSKKGFQTELRVDAHIGPDYQLKDMNFYLKSNILTIVCKGKVRGSKMLLDIVKDGKKIKQVIALPKGTMLSSPVGMPGKYTDLKVGKIIRSRWLEPTTQKFRTSTSLVKAKINYYWCGQEIPVYVIRTESAPLKATSWVTQDGEVLQYQIFSFTFIKQPNKRKQ